MTVQSRSSSSCHKSGKFSPPLAEGNNNKKMKQKMWTTGADQGKISPKHDTKAFCGWGQVRSSHYRHQQESELIHTQQIVINEKSACWCLNGSSWKSCPIRDGKRDAGCRLAMVILGCPCGLFKGCLEDYRRTTWSHEFNLELAVRSPFDVMKSICIATERWDHRSWV